jgi:hypothetical protein
VAASAGQTRTIGPSARGQLGQQPFGPLRKMWRLAPSPGFRSTWTRRARGCGWQIVAALRGLISIEFSRLVETTN